VKLVRLRRPKAMCSLSYVEYRPNTNVATLVEPGKVMHRWGKEKEGN
jgi:hypothetical protein